VADKIKNADLAFINQETVICNGEFEVSGSNLNFNSPMELGDDLIDIGFDIINMANNHVLDKGSSGMRACLDYWDAQCEKHDNVRVLGAYRDYQDMYDYRITEANGITVGILGYTEHTNGYSLPGDSQMRIPYLYDRELMEKQVRELDSLVDCVVVSTHWGVEDTHIVTDEMKSLSQDLIDWGADVIIGTGPHTLESMEYLSRGDGTQGFVYYSLGNFISGQTDNFNMVGGMALFDIVKKDGVTSIENPKLTPLINQYETGKLRDVRVIPYYEYTDELVQSHGIPDSPMGSAKSWSWDVINTIIENNVPEEYRQLEE
jgi:poly-gamma-glutamate synthesis protein (capsule biosynthesis protein)